MYPFSKLCIDKAAVIAKEPNDILVYKGQGEGETK
jgi:hypothetical protein